ncbi:hypothetical protein ScPMuIL_004728 [Solemya velum]
MDKDVDILKTWYRSIRTHYTSLVHRKSGDGTSKLTERDHWILLEAWNFAWLRVHVVEVKKKTTVSMKEKIAGEPSVEDVDDDQRKVKSFSIRSPSKSATPLSSYSTDHSSSSTKPTPGPPQTSRTPAQCGSLCLSSGLQLSSRTCLCGGCRVWVQGQMTELQPMQMTTVVREPASPALFATATTSTHTQSAEPPLNLSSFVSNSIDMCETSLDRTVAILDDCMDQEKELYHCARNTQEV